MLQHQLSVLEFLQTGIWTKFCNFVVSHHNKVVLMFFVPSWWHQCILQANPTFEKVTVVKLEKHLGGPNNIHLQIVTMGKRQVIMEVAFFGPFLGIHHFLLL